MLLVQISLPITSENKFTNTTKKNGVHALLTDGASTVFTWFPALRLNEQNMLV